MLFDPTQDLQYIDCFPHTINLLSKVESATFGGQPTYTTAYGNVPALVTRAGSRLQEIYAQRNITVTHRILVNQAISLTTGAIVQFEGSRYFFIDGVQDVLQSGTMFSLDTHEVFDLEIVVES